MSDAQTLRIYAEKAYDYAALTDRVNTDDPALAAFISELPAGGRVLDLGCGPGAAAARMAKSGLRVEACDPVREMVELARARPGVTVRQAGVEDLDASEDYHGVWANFSLLHAKRDDMPANLDRIAKALKPGGLFHIAVKTGTGAGRDAIGRAYTYYEEDELTALLGAAGLSVLSNRTGADAGLSGEVAPWIALLARRA